MIKKIKSKIEKLIDYKRNIEVRLETYRPPNVLVGNAEGDKIQLWLVIDDKPNFVCESFTMDGLLDSFNDIAEVLERLRSRTIDEVDINAIHNYIDLTYYPGLTILAFLSNRPINRIIHPNGWYWERIDEYSIGLYKDGKRVRILTY